MTPRGPDERDRWNEQEGAYSPEEEADQEIGDLLEDAPLRACALLRAGYR